MSTSFLRTCAAMVLLLGGSATAGWAASLAGVPLAWMVAPLIFTAAATLLFNLPRLPVFGRYVGQVIVGVAVGLYLTPAALDRIIVFAVPILVGAAFVTFAACAIAHLQIRFASVNPATAIFANVPGGPIDMAMLAEQHGGDPARTALAQTLRITLVVLVLPPILLGFSTNAPARVLEFGDWQDSLVLLSIGAAAGLLFKLVRLINPFFLGPLIVAGSLTAGDVNLSHFHAGVVPAAQVLLGVSLGGMFQRSVFRDASQFLLSLLVTSFALLAVSAVAAEFLVLAFDADFATMMLSNAPGAVTEMVVTAQVLQLDVTLVASFQFIRIIFSLLVASAFFKLYRERR